MEVEKWQVDEARKIAEDAYLVYANLKAQYIQAEQDWMKKAQVFRKLDYRLAEIDGRLKKIVSKSPQAKKVPELTIDQLKAIAEKLGISIPELDKIENGEALPLEEVVEEENYNEEA